jgi:gliding motility-associated-like protein
MNLSPIVSKHIPEFVNDDYPLFVKFIKTYYKWLDETQINSIEEALEQFLLIEWGNSNYKTFFPQSVEVNLVNGKNIRLSVDWNTSDLNILKSGDFEIVGTFNLPFNIYNPFKVKAILKATILPKPSPRNVELDNQKFEGAANDYFVMIGSFDIDDPIDNVHEAMIYSDGYDNKFFEIKDNVLFWSSADPGAGKTKFTVLVRVTDRDGNTLDKFFEITRTRSSISEIIIFDTFSPDGDQTNETWGVPELRFYSGVKIQIYERGGVRVFYTENPDVKWDGIYKDKDMPIGSYYWIIEVGETGETRRGILNLLRK